MPVPVDKITDPNIILHSLPRIISGQLFRDVLDIIYTKEGTESWDYCSFVDLRREVFEKPAGRWAGDVLKGPEYPVNIRPKVVTEMLDLMVGLKWVERFGSIGLRLTIEGKRQRRHIHEDMLDICRSLYREKAGTDGA